MMFVNSADKTRRVYWTNPEDETDPITVTVATLLGIIVDRGLDVVAVTDRGMRDIKDVSFVPDCVEGVYYDEDAGVVFRLGTENVPPFKYSP